MLLKYLILIQFLIFFPYGMLHKEQQTWARGAMGPSLLDKQNLGLLNAKAGTVPGELLRFLTQFKLVPFSMFKTFMLDVPRSAKRYSEMGIPLSPFEVRAKYISALMITNVVREQLTALARLTSSPS
ncbi:hypothetical protein [Candidatus Liberibacter sp.]|uniref:hypothetical protein n=1 Tax=Candidatus Liberibacter sp. TaxID=34022 RepID=UPI0015F4D368|nr:hypothetical protein [Candidatus Liberibacter sp.]MBA5723794.1 hypothetical protein [Candidatus Liberibacter sp.]